MNLLKAILLITILQSCSPAQRLGRLVSKHPELVGIDTIYKQDTTIIESVRADSTFIFSHVTDTFYMDKDRLHVKIVRYNDTIQVFGECSTDTIIKEIMVQTNEVNPVLIKNNWWGNVAMIAALIIGLFFLVLLLRFLIKKSL